MKALRNRHPHPALCPLLCLTAVLLGMIAAAPDLNAIDFEIALTADQEVPSPSLGDSNPVGTAIVSVDIVTGGVMVAGTYEGTTSAVAAAHIHGFADPGGTAGVMIGLTVSGGTSGTTAGGGVLTSEQLTQLLRGRTYINVHTANNGGGEIRGQIVDPTIRMFEIELSPKQEVPPVVIEGGSSSGTARVVVDSATGAIEVAGGYASMSSDVAAAHIHGLADRVENAGVILGLAVSGGAEGTISGKDVLSESNLAGLFGGFTYLNVHTANNGSGEIRGQIDQPLAELPEITLEPVLENALVSPVAITNAGDGSGRMFIVDQRGTVQILRDGQLLSEPFLDISGKLVPERPGFDERGLLSIAFPSDFATSGSAGEGRFYAYYSAPSPDAPGTEGQPVDHRSVIAEFSVLPGNPDKADAASEREVMTFAEPQFNHDGGQLAFGPADGLLYISTGDGGSSDDNDAGHTGGSADKPSGVLGNAQDTSTLLGKILRIDPNGSDGEGAQYGIPADNPFVGQAGFRPEIFAFGLRNPWRFSFDDGPGGTNRLFVADVGQRDVEEINIVEAGGNYGWRPFEGTIPFDAAAPRTAGPFTAPIAEYAHPNSAVGLPRLGVSITGGHVYRGTSSPDLRGVYVFGDWSQSFQEPSGTLLGLVEQPDGGHRIGVFPVQGGNPLNGYIPTFGEDESGNLYVATKRTLAPSELDENGQPTGSLFRIATAVVVPEPVTVVLEPSRDNSIYSESNKSNGGGQYLFTGRTAPQNAGALRRALLQFNLASVIPAGSTIQLANLTLRMNKSIAGAEDVRLHRLLADWGEATSNASGEEGTGAVARNGDVTWQHRFFSNDRWQTEGGDFVLTASATTSVNRSGNYDWTGSEMVTDAQSWIDSPDSNFGWILITRETGSESAKRFDSRDATNADRRPKLAITYLPGVQEVSNRDQWISQFYEKGEVVDLAADLDGDTLSAAFEYGYGFDPKIPNPPAAGFAVAVDPETREINVTFRRDPRAIDLIYRVETSTDLSRWDPLVESSAGNAATGVGLISELAIGEGPFQLVTAKASVAADGFYVRLVLIVAED